MIRILATAAAAVLATIAIASPGQAQDAELTPGIVEQIDIAAKLTNYGVERSDPLLLLAAAKLIATLSPEAATSTSPLTPAELVDKARSVSAGSAEIAKLADDISAEVSRGLCYGPGTYYGCF